MIALLFITLHQDPDIIAAPQPAAPICIEFCDAQGEPNEN